jgi:hypothetical protein
MTRKSSYQKWFPRGLLLAAGVVVCIGGIAAPAYAVPGQTDAGTTQANVEISSAITLTGLTPAFTLTGVPGDTPTAPVTMTVTTNNFAGYVVTVAPQTATLAGAVPGNTTTIAIADLEVLGSDVDAIYQPLAFGTPTVVGTKAAPSAADGDVLGNTYQMEIPFIQPDTYSATLDYVATTL